MVLPLWNKNPPESFPFGTCLLVVVNLGVFALTTHGGHLREDVLRVYGTSCSHFAPYRSFTALFLHGDWAHLIGNMWFLCLFGFAVEGRIRTGRFLGLYFASGLAGDLLEALCYGRFHPDGFGFGASGAISGIMLASLYLFPFAPVIIFVFFEWVFEFVEWPMWGAASCYVVIDLLFALLGVPDGIGHYAHLGGALGGLVVVALMRPRRDSVEASGVKAMLSETNDLGILGYLELEELHRSQPDNALVALHWMDRGIRERNGPSLACYEAYQRLFPAMLKEIDPRAVASTALCVATRRGLISNRELLELGSRLEGVGEQALAVSVYGKVVSFSGEGDDDWLSARFRVGTLEESAARFDRARECYDEIVRRWPLSPHAEMARFRLGRLR